MSHHVVPVRVYAAVFTSLMVLTTLTVWVAFQSLSDPWNDVIALTIAVCKATVVVLFFMHVRYSTRLTTLVVLTAGLFLMILLGLTLSDFFSRGWLVPYALG